MRTHSNRISDDNLLRANDTDRIGNERRQRTPDRSRCLALPPRRPSRERRWSLHPAVWTAPSRACCLALALGLPTARGARHTRARAVKRCLASAGQRKLELSSRLLVHLLVEPDCFHRHNTLVGEAHGHALCRLGGEGVHIHRAKARFCVGSGVVVCPLGHVALLAEARVWDGLTIKLDWQAVALCKGVVGYERLFLLGLRPAVRVLILRSAR
mmetsp:Transcript_8016/g.22040  ORF Transcript_8016/g.22040 Transcript_8016/m.22040 type:complete len:213 (-) Transcript_8016:154-792(-)